MTKIDYRKELKQLYSAPRNQVVPVLVPEMNFLMVDGSGDPNTAPAFAQAIDALYSVSYTLKFAVKKSNLAIDYGVLPLEGLWWMENSAEFDPTKKDAWLWTAMIAQPEFVSVEHVERALSDVAAKKDLPALPLVRFARFDEGLAAQIMHIGPFATEGPTIEKLHRYIVETNHQLRGKHHEIYLSDPRRTAPNKLKTIIRQPMR